MPNDPTKRVEAEGNLISLQQADEIAYWTHRFGVTLEELQAAVRAVGDRKDSVEEYLRKRGHVIVRKI